MAVGRGTIENRLSTLLDRSADEVSLEKTKQHNHRSSPVVLLFFEMGSCYTLSQLVWLPRTKTSDCPMMNVSVGAANGFPLKTGPFVDE